jgi:hypothetical protein
VAKARAAGLDDTSIESMLQAELLDRDREATA